MGTIDCTDKCVFCGNPEVEIPCLVWSVTFFGRANQVAVCSTCLDSCSARGFWESLFRMAKLSWPPTFQPDGWDYGQPKTDNDQRIPRGESVSHPERSKMTNSIRYDVMSRDGFRCQLCGATSNEDRLEVDHIHPVSKGGKTEMANLRTLCFRCNSGKSDKVEG